MTTFNFQCFACQAVLRAKTKLCGSTIDCPKCGAALIVPDYSPPVSVPSGPPVNVFQPNFSIAVDDDEPIGGLGYAKRNGSQANLFLSILGAFGLVFFVFVICLVSKKSGQDIQSKLESAGIMLFWVIAFFVSMMFYMIPTIIAALRKHPNLAPIAAVNLLLGVLFIGWVVALVWSLTEFRSRNHYHYHNYGPSNH